LSWLIIEIINQKEFDQEYLEKIQRLCKRDSREKLFQKAITIAMIAHIQLEQRDYDAYLAKGVEKYKVPYYVGYKILCHMCPLGYCDKLHASKSYQQSVWHPVYEVSCKERKQSRF